MLTVFLNFSVIGWRDKLPQTSSFETTLGPVVQQSCHFLLQGIFPTQGSISYLPHFLHCRQSLFPTEAPYLHAQSLSCVQLFVIPLTVACEVPLSMEVSRQERQSGVAIFYSWGSSRNRALPESGLKPTSLVTSALQVNSFTAETLGEANYSYSKYEFIESR